MVTGSVYWPPSNIDYLEPGKVVRTSRGSRLCVISSFMFEIRTEGYINVGHVSQNSKKNSFDANTI